MNTKRPNRLNLTLIVVQIGKGTFSEVFKVQRKTDQKIYALKKVTLDQLSVRER